MGGRVWEQNWLRTNKYLEHSKFTFRERERGRRMVSGVAVVEAGTRDQRDKHEAVL